VATSTIAAALTSMLPEAKPTETTPAMVSHANASSTRKRIGRGRIKARISVRASGDNRRWSPDNGDGRGVVQAAENFVVGSSRLRGAPVHPEGAIEPRAARAFQRFAPPNVDAPPDVAVGHAIRSA